MRIFYASHATSDTGIPGSQTWTRNILWALRDLGHDVVVFDYDLDSVVRFVDPAVTGARSYIERQRPRTSDELVRQVRRARDAGGLDLFFSYFYSAMVEPAAVRTIAELGIPTVNWYCNASYQFDLVAEIAPAFDVCLVPERFRLDDYRAVGANPVYCQEAANPLVYRPKPELAQEFDVTFVGQRYGDRPVFVRELVQNSIDIRVWGAGWTDVPPSFRGKARRQAARLLTRSWSIPKTVVAPPLDDDSYVDMYSRSRISLGFSKVADPLRDGTIVKQVRLRDFEAPMSGAFYLLEHSDEIEDFFVPDEEIVCFGDGDELVEKARYYLGHDDERERVRRAGRERALRDHTWQHRLTDAFRRAGLSAPGGWQG
jgi:spore maturation protein CgeB